MQYLQYKDTIQPGVSTILVSLIVTFVLWYDIFMPDYTTSGASLIMGDSPLVHLLNGYVPFDSLPCRIAALACLIITGYCMVSLNGTFAFINVRTILPALIFAITTSLLMRPHEFSSAWIITLCVVLFVNSTFKLVEGSSDQFITRAFDAGFVLSIASLFAVQSIVLAIPYFVMLYRCNTFHIRLFFSFLTGLFLPQFYCALIALALNNIEVWTNYWSVWLNFGGSITQENGFDQWIYIGIIVILFIVSFQYFLRSRSNQNVRSREEVVFLIFCFFTTLVIMLMSWGNAQIFWPTSLFFGAFIIGQYFSLEWSLPSKILLAIFALSSILFFIQPNVI